VAGETMRRHVERELARARARGRETLGVADSTPVSEIVESLFGILRRTDKGEQIAFINDAPPTARAPFERSDLTEALGNILDNAVRYASATVRVSCEGGPDALTIVVEDDGPGVEPDTEALVRQRGGRLDETGGAGLGLSLVQDIINAYEWRMDFGRSPLGGLKLQLAPKA
jgi:signal transduction histidine kinase